jgi:hypothetical protein
LCGGEQGESGEQGFVNLLHAGQTEEQALSFLLGSAEFFNRAQTLVASGTPQERFVQALYLLLLDRTAAPNEVAGWVNALPVLGRQGVAQGFLMSREFRTYQFEGFYNALLHRPSAAGDQPFISGLVVSSTDFRTARILFEGSPEFYSNG